VNKRVKSNAERASNVRLWYQEKKTNLSSSLKVLDKVHVSVWLLATFKQIKLCKQLNIVCVKTKPKMSVQMRLMYTLYTQNDGTCCEYM